MVLTFFILMMVSLLLSYNLSHVLNCLIFLEGLALFNFWALLNTSLTSVFNVSLIMLYFVITVSSAALGLSLLITICRSHGQDFLLSYNLTF